MKNIGNIIKSHNSKIFNERKNNLRSCNCQRKENCPLNGHCMAENVVYAAHVSVHHPRNIQDTPNSIHGTTPRRTTPRHTTPRHTTPSRTTGQSIGSNANDTSLQVIEPSQAPTVSLHNIRGEAIYIGAAENFKQRYGNHLKSFRHIHYKKETTLSEHIWLLKSNNVNFSIKWKILKRTSGYNKISKTCSLCTTEKMEICKFRIKNKNRLLNKRNEMISKCRHENKHLLGNFPDP